jgi:chromosome segregation ATPase
MLTNYQTEVPDEIGGIKSDGNRLTSVFLSMICFAIFFIGVTGCTSSTIQGSRKKEGLQPKTSHLETARDSIAKQNRTKVKPPSLAQAKADLKLARQKVKLAELKMELSVLEMKLADFHQKIAETMVRKAEVFKQCQKLESDYPKGRGIKAAVIDELEALKTKSLDLESENIKTKAAMAKIDLNIQKLKRKVDLQINRRTPATPETR